MKPAGEITQAEAEGFRKSDARFKRKCERLTEALADHVVKNGALRHEVRKLEDLLAWIYVTEQPIEKVRQIIRRTISRRIIRLKTENAERLLQKDWGDVWDELPEAPPLVPREEIVCTSHKHYWQSGHHSCACGALTVFPIDDDSRQVITLVGISVQPEVH